MIITQPKYTWYKDLDRYQWFVVAVACVGWMFDTMAQQLFNLARVPALRDLMGGNATAAAVSEQAGDATMIFMIGWAVGGAIFGVLGDRLGRAKTMMLTILCYTIFTGLSLLSIGVWDFNAYRFLCGLGVGGQFAVGVSLVAEVVPQRARPYALGMVQAFSTVGNMMAAATGIFLGHIQQSGAIAPGLWEMRVRLVARFPRHLHLDRGQEVLEEPAQWLKARAWGKKSMGSLRELTIRSPLEAQFDYWNAAGFLRRGRAMGHRFF